MKKKIRLVALDMDGTLFNNYSQILDDDQLAIREATSNEIEVIISTGRPYIGLPTTQLASLGIRYVITSNGAGIYQIPDKKCLYESCMSPELICPLIDELQKKTSIWMPLSTGMVTADAPVKLRLHYWTCHSQVY